MALEPVVSPEEIIETVTDLLLGSMHMKQAHSVALAVAGAMYADKFTIAEVGRSMARVRGMSAKHGIKQFDRLLSDPKVNMARVFKVLVPWIVADRKEIVVSFDWTTYGADGHSRIAINLVINHGRATPLLWKTVSTGSLRRTRNRFEDEALLLLAEVLPPDVKVTLLADRGFGNVKLYEFLRDKLHSDFVIRFREAIQVETPNGERAPASEWVPTNGQILEIFDARVTTERFPVGVVCVKKRDMKEA